MAPPDDHRERAFRDAILYLMDVAACLVRRPQAPDPNADELVDRFVDLVAQHRRARDRESFKAMTVQLAEDLARIYREHRHDREAQKLAITELFGDALAPGALEDLALTADEITEHRGPVEAARTEIGDLFADVKARSLLSWRDQAPLGAPPTAYGARTGARGLVRIALRLAGHPAPRFTREILSAIGFDDQRARQLADELIVCGEPPESDLAAATGSGTPAETATGIDTDGAPEPNDPMEGTSGTLEPDGPSASGPDDDRTDA